MFPGTKGKKDQTVGGSWVICDSKSRPGLKYYFNTESGEAVWNLNDKDQIEKAKKHTQLLYTKFGAGFELPEPQGQPPMDARRNLKLPTMNQMPNHYSHMNTGANNRSFNGNVWTNPPAVIQQPQFLILPTTMLNPPVGNNNIQSTLAFQNTLPFTYQNYGDYNVPINNSNCGNVLHNNNRGRKFYRNKQFQRNQGENYRQGCEDLRKKLVRKRSFSESNVEECHNFNFNTNSNDSEDSCPTNEATEEISNESPTDTFKVDDCYVVVDKDVILSEFVFLDNLVSNEPNFRLVVPHHVMSELKRHACENSEARVRRIVRFLSQKIESRLVSLGEEIEESSCQNEDKTFITCEQLEKEEKNIILVSNKSEMRKFKGKKIKTMSMCKFKEMLSNTKAKFTSPTRAIKIIIPNDTQTEYAKNTKNNNSIRVEIQIENKEKKQNKVENKRTVDTAIQTEIDTELNKTSSQENDEVDKTIRNENTTKKREIRLNRTSTKITKIEETSKDKMQFKWRRKRTAANNSSNSKLTQSNINVTTETSTNIASETIVKPATDMIRNVTVTESKQKENSSKTESENSFAIPITNTNMSPIIDREQVKATHNFVSEKDTKKNKEVCRQASTESWVESLPKCKSDTDKDSRGSSQRSVNKTNSSTSTLVKNVNSVVHKVPVKPVNKNIFLKNVEMFTVAGHSMEEALRTRSDEWVSRFVQIMEEVLKDKLQENPPFDNDEYPPPWNLHEAARCIIKKYSDYFNVVDAANKLSFILYKVSDEKGKILLSLQPSEFMEMYSYGVYLVETLQDVSSNCDDLHAAKESLKTLLYDIQNANKENTFNETFGDDLGESPVEYTTSTDVTESDFRPGREQSTPIKKTLNRCSTNTKPKKKHIEASSLYNLRSVKQTPPDAPEVSQSKSPSADKKTTFLSNLKLVTRSSSSPSTITSPAYSNLTVRSPVKSPVKSLPVANKLNDNKPNKNYTTNKETITNDEEIVSSSGQPNFIRNFQTCPEFEARIKKARSILEFNECDEPYSDHFINNQYFQTKNCVPKDDIDVPTQIDDNTLIKQFNNNFGWSFGDLHLRYMKETFADVIQNLSVRASNIQREELKSRATKLLPQIEDIYNSLDSILKRADYCADNSLKVLLKNVNADSAEEKMFCLQNRKTIKEFRDQACNIIKYLKLILSTS